MKDRIAAAAALAAVAALTACDHAQPFGAPNLGPNVPFSTSFPRQLTFNPLGDVQPAWLPGDSGIVYSLSVGAPTNDHCLGILPPGGGHLTATICHNSPYLADSTYALWLPAPGPQLGRFAYQRDRSGIGAFAPNASELVLATLQAPDSGRVLLQFPYTTPDGSFAGGMRDLQWLSGGTLVLRAGALTFTGPPLTVDTLFTPVAIDRVDLVGPTVVLSTVPGTSGATSLATDTVSAMYYTLPGDSRVYRLADGAPSPTVWYDFGAAGVPTLIRVAGDGGSGSVLVALVGGTLYAVHGGAGAPIPLDMPPVAVENIALARSGRFLVVAGGDAGAPDLWLLEVP